MQGAKVRVRSFREQQLQESAHRVHPVENTKRLAQVHQDEPGREAEELLPQAVLKLRVDSKGRNDPELREERKTAVSAAGGRGRGED